MSQQKEVKGINLTKLKRQFIQLNQHGLYTTLFYYYSIVVFAFLGWIFLSSNFSSIPDSTYAESPLYQSHLAFRILFWIGIVGLALVQLAAYFQRRLKKVNTAPMVLLIAGYISSALFVLVSRPLIKQFKNAYSSTDPFKNTISSFQILGGVNFELYGLFITLSLVFFVLAFVLFILKHNHFEFKVVRQR